LVCSVAPENVKLVPDGLAHPDPVAVENDPENAGEVGDIVTEAVPTVRPELPDGTVLLDRETVAIV